ncbi:hypothetical protein RIR_jg39966.t1 [Rhizophagus irregularis DAOM 181602=DAOM 197198]|nr:hypothetical protein RIR_jg39966.t1 [Rhizophagus irregularis DAOM 181602=DAOM 197198]
MKKQSVKVEIHFELEKAKEFEEVDKGVLVSQVNSSVYILRWFVAFKNYQMKDGDLLNTHLQQKEIKISHPRSVKTEESKDGRLFRRKE